MEQQCCSSCGWRAVSDAPKKPGTKGFHTKNPREDGSVSFRLVGGRWDGITCRLYPQDDQHNRLKIGGGEYIWDGTADKPAMHWHPADG